MSGTRVGWAIDWRALCWRTKYPWHAYALYAVHGWIIHMKNILLWHWLLLYLHHSCSSPSFIVCIAQHRKKHLCHLLFASSVFFLTWKKQNTWRSTCLSSSSPVNVANSRSRLRSSSSPSSHRWRTLCLWTESTGWDTEMKINIYCRRGGKNIWSENNFLKQERKNVRHEFDMKTFGICLLVLLSETIWRSDCM